MVDHAEESDLSGAWIEINQGSSQTEVLSISCILAERLLLSTIIFCHHAQRFAFIFKFKHRGISESICTADFWLSVTECKDMRKRAVVAEHLRSVNVYLVLVVSLHFPLGLLLLAVCRRLEIYFLVNGCSEYRDTM